MSSETYGFDAIRGIQAGREYYVVICPLKVIPRLFIFNGYEIPPELRAQRTLRRSRIPELKSYILNNPDEYIFSSLTASIDGPTKFIPAMHLGPNGKIGRLYIDMTARILINDGQHRRKAIEEALREKPELGYETISIVFYEDNGLKRSQQMFSDLNRNPLRSPKSLNILYDHRSRFARFIVDMAKNVPIFRNRVEFEKTTISKRSPKVFTLNAIHDATEKFLGRGNVRRILEVEKETMPLFWENVGKNIPEWQLLLNGEMAPFDLRTNFVHTNTNCLNSLGIVGRVIREMQPKYWRSKMTGLRNIDWSRDNPLWEGNLLQGGRMVRTVVGIELGANVILEKCGIRLDEKRRRHEAR